MPPKRPCPALPDGYVCSTTTQIRFGYPATWGALTSSDGGFVRSMIWLSTEPFHKPCTSTTEGERTTVVCGSPVSSLRPNGVLVSWRMGGTSSFNLDALPGIPAMIGGGSARIALLSNGSSSRAAGSSAATKRSSPGRRARGAGSTVCRRACAVRISRGRRPRSPPFWPPRAFPPARKPAAAGNRDVPSKATSRCRTPRRARHQRVSPAKESLYGGASLCCHFSPRLGVRHHYGSVTNVPQGATSTRPSRASDSTASRSRSLSGRSDSATSRSVCARRWRNEPSKRDCLRSGS